MIWHAEAVKESKEQDGCSTTPEAAPSRQPAVRRMQGVQWQGAATAALPSPPQLAVEGEGKHSSVIIMDDPPCQPPSSPGPQSPA